MRRALSFVLMVIIVMWSINAFCFEPVEDPTTPKYYTFDSEIDPEEFLSWDILAIKELTPGSLNTCVAIVKNPIPGSRILQAFLRVEDYTIIGYAYLIDNVLYRYDYNRVKKHFGRFVHFGI